VVPPIDTFFQIMVNIEDDSPELVQFWAAQQSSNSRGGLYYYTGSSPQGAFSRALWAVDLDIPNGFALKVDAHIPGSSQPQNRTARARYLITSANANPDVVMITHQRAASQWVTLGTFPFRAGRFQVELTDETGEPAGTRVIVADAVRWTNA
jgi:hypothetical protein